MSIDTQPFLDEGDVPMTSTSLQMNGHSPLEQANELIKSDPLKAEKLLLSIIEEKPGTILFSLYFLISSLALKVSYRGECQGWYGIERKGIGFT